MSKVALWKIFEERSSWEILKCNHEHVTIYNLVFSRFIFRYDPLFETPYKQGVWKRRLSVKIRTHMWQFLCKQKNVKKYVVISKPKKRITCQNLFYRNSLYFFTSCNAQTYFNHSKSQKHSQELTNRHCEIKTQLRRSWTQISVCIWQKGYIINLIPR